MVDAAVFMFFWLGFGMVMTAVMHAFLGTDIKNETTTDISLSALLWPITVWSPVAAIAYVLAQSLREKISDREA